MPERQQILRTVAAAILHLPISHVVRVGIDGVDGAGKSIFGDELAQILADAGRPIIRASVDGFHNPAPDKVSVRHLIALRARWGWRGTPPRLVRRYGHTYSAD